MSRHDGSHSGGGYPVFQLEVEDYSRFNNARFKTFLSDTEHGKEKIDIFDKVPCRTLVQRFKSYKAAMRWGSRFGTVVHCAKVDIVPYHLNIEHLNLNQEPVAIEIIKEEYVLTKALELKHGKIIEESVDNH